MKGIRKLLAVVTFAGTILGFLATTGQADAYVRVKGYQRRDGTYVRPYVRSSPNALRYDNYGYDGGSLYNRSYSYPTRRYSSSWYTPSYLTDPDYYAGKSLYDSGSLYGSYLYPSYGAYRSRYRSLLNY